MEVSHAHDGRVTQARRRKQRRVAARILATGSLIAVVAITAKIVFSFTGTSSTHKSAAATGKQGAGKHTSISGPTNKPSTTTVPILVYHVINVQPPGSSLSPRLYVSPSQFSAQMQALKTAGWHPVTLNQLAAFWSRGVPLAAGKPIVITFDNGYASQYTNALPVLKQFGWVGVENVQVKGLPPADGGLTESQIRGLIAAGWELDAEGVSQPDLTVLGSGNLGSEVAGARQELQTRYSAPVNWFAYPSGDYNQTVTAAVRSAGFTGAMTTVRGWASPRASRFLLPRIDVAGGTSPTALLSQIAAAAKTTTAPTSFHA